MKWTIGFKLAFSFLVMVVMTGAVGWAGLSGLSAAGESLNLVVRDQVAQIERVNRTIELVNDNALLSFENLYADAAAVRANARQQEQNRQQITTLLEEIEQREGESRLFAEVTAKRKPFVEAFADLQRVAEAEQKEAATVLVTTRLIPAMVAFKEALTRLSEDVDREMVAAQRAAEETHARTRWVMLSFLGAALGLAVLVAFLTTRSITTPIREAVALTEKVASGDFRVKLDTNRGDEIGQLLTALQSMVQRLGRTVGGIRSAASALSAAAGQVSSTANSLSQGTSEQASSVEETTSTLEQITASISQNAGNAKQTEQLAIKGASAADESGRAVTETVSVMKQIAGRVSIIEEIAYQTNMLALNAAVEAARAGDHGRGFAVVATEVRKLAERSRTAAKEISEVASGSVQVAERSGQLLKELVPTIQKSADLFQEVAAASGEQATGVSQMNRAMTQMNEVTQRNASSAEELSSTAEEMAAQAEELDQLVGLFKLDDEERLHAKGHAKKLHHPSVPKAAPPKAGVLPPGARVEPPVSDSEFQQF